MPKQRKSKAGASLRRWFKEEWVDISKKRKDGSYAPCGRKSRTGKGKDGEKRSYPKCRPKKRVSSKTPKTAGELSKSEKQKLIREKKKIKGKRSKYTLTQKKKKTSSRKKKK